MLHFVILSEAKNLHLVDHGRELQILRFALQKENAYVLCFLSAYQGQPPRLSMLRMTKQVGLADDSTWATHGRPLRDWQQTPGFGVFPCDHRKAAHPNRGGPRHPQPDIYLDV